jgi:hypothetical protein
MLAFERCRRRPILPADWAWILAQIRAGCVTAIGDLFDGTQATICQKNYCFARDGLSSLLPWQPCCLQAHWQLLHQRFSATRIKVVPLKNFVNRPPTADAKAQILVLSANANTWRFDMCHSYAPLHGWLYGMFGKARTASRCLRSLCIRYSPPATMIDDPATVHLSGICPKTK